MTTKLYQYQYAPQTSTIINDTHTIVPQLVHLSNKYVQHVIICMGRKCVSIAMFVQWDTNL